jgi:hypothetical protein
MTGSQFSNESIHKLSTRVEILISALIVLALTLDFEDLNAFPVQYGTPYLLKPGTFPPSLNLGISSRSTFKLLTSADYFL